MYSYKTKVSYSKLDRNGKVPFYEIMNYLQDCSTFQSEYLGVGIEYLKQKHKAWILLSYKIQIIREPILGEEIEVGTCPFEFGKVIGTRQFYIKDSNGEFIVKAESLWSLMDTETRMAIRIKDEDKSMYKEDEAFKSIGVSRKIKFLTEKQMTEKIKAPHTCIDTNGHLNNADYLRIVAECFPDADIHKYNQIEIAYKKEILESEYIKVYRYDEKDGKGVSFENVDGQEHACIKFSNI
jgi:acyl-ACP thioesterase